MINRLVAILIVLLIPQVAGAALDFTGGDTDKVNHGSSAATDNIPQGTIIVWIKFDVLTGLRGFFSKLNDAFSIGPHFYHPGADATLFRITVPRATTNQQAATATGALTTNTWYFLAGTWDITNGGPKVYKGTATTTVQDVTLAGAETFDGSGTQSDDNAASWMGGNLTQTGSQSVDAQIARVYLFNRDLSLEELRLQQFQGPPVVSGALVYSEYGFNGTGTQADWSGKLNNGTVTGAGFAPHAPLRAPFAIADQEEQSFAMRVYKRATQFAYNIINFFI